MTVDYESMKHCPFCGKELAWKDFGIEEYPDCPEHGSIVDVQADGEFIHIQIWRGNG